MVEKGVSFWARQDNQGPGSWWTPASEPSAGERQAPPLAGRSGRMSPQKGDIYYMTRALNYCKIIGVERAEQKQRKEMNMRTSHTTKAGQAKCLNYRNSKRCGRLARYLTSEKRFPVCAECKRALGGEVISHSEKGYTVKESQFGPVTHEYTPIERLCIECNTPVTNKVDRHCYLCGVEATDCEALERLYHAADSVSW